MSETGRDPEPAPTVVDPADERAHPPGGEPLWGESWYFDFTDEAGSLGGYVRIGLVPNQGTCWYCGCLVGEGRPLVTVIDHDVPIPRSGSLEIRTEGLWADHTVEVPLDHVTLGLEAFAVGLDDPAELYGRQFGDQVPLGFDLEWEAQGPAVAGGHGAYRQTCQVGGEVLVGREELDLEGRGERAHEWGVLTAWDHRWFRLHGWVGGVEVDVAVTDGDLTSARGAVDGDPAVVGEVAQAMSAPGIPASGRVRVGPFVVTLEPVGITPVELVDPEGRRVLAPRAMCRLATPEGGAGWGWAEWNEPQP